MSIIKGYGSGDATSGFYTKTLDDSLRFDEGPNQTTIDSSYLTRAAVTPTSAYKWTLSVWIKLSSTDSRGILASDGNEESLKFGGSGLVYRHVSGGALRISVQTNNKFRDTSNWYHVVCAVDHSNSTTNDKVILYVNGVRQTSLFVNTIASATYDSTLLTAGNTIQIGKDRSGGHLDGYMSEMHFVDGQQLTPTTFGETKQGVWIPKSVSGLTYGNNGFYLNFGNSSAIGEDSAGSNDYTAYNLNAHDIVPDTPTNNFAVLNALELSGGTLSEGNLKFTGKSGVGAGYYATRATFGMTSGKWYFEGLATDDDSMVGIGTASASLDNYLGGDAHAYGYAGHNGQKYNNNSGSSYGATFQNGDIIGVAFDADNGTLTFYKNNISQGTAFTSLTATPYFPMVGESAQSSPITTYLNFGQDSTFAYNKTSGSTNASDGNGKGDFYYAPPSGYLALCSSNLPDVTLSANEDEQPNDYFETNIYTGVGGSATLTSFNFKPDFTWIKNITDTSTNHVLVDSSRGSSKELQLPSTGAETSNGWISAFTTNGFTHSAQGSATQNVVFDAYSVGSGGSQRWYPKVPAGISIQIGSTTYNAGDNISASDTTTLIGARGANARNVAWTSSGDISYYGWSSGNANINSGSYTDTTTSPYTFGGYRYQASQPNCRSVAGRFRSDGGMEFINYYENYNQIYDDPPLYQCSGNIDSFQGVITGTISSVEVANVNVTAGASTYDPVNKNNSKYATWNWKGDTSTPNITYTVKVVSDSGNKYRFNNFGTSAVTLDLQEGGVYTFNMDDSSNASHPFSIGESANGTVYTSGITYSLDGVSKTYSEYTSGFASATTRRLVFTVPSSAPGLYYWCYYHSGMGGAINTNSTKGSSNFVGSIQSKVQSNSTAGFSIVTGTAPSGTYSFGHGLTKDGSGVAPDVFIFKSTANSENWIVYHKNKTTSVPSQSGVYLNSSLAGFTSGGNWVSEVSSTKVEILTGQVTGTGNFICYLFNEIQGYSKFGSYEGNNSSTDNAFVFTGFLPSFIAIKNIDAAEDWTIRDIEHSGYYTDRANPIPIGVQPSTSTNATGGSAFNIDFVSNGFKVRGNNADVGASNTYIYLAFASNPFKFNNAR